MKLIRLLSLKNNYTWILYKNNQAIIIDPGDHNNVLTIIKEKSLIPIAVLLTHCHADHFQGVFNLVKKYSIEIYSPKKINGLNIKILKKHLILLNEIFFVISLPGHTLEHVGFYKKPWLFCGDTIFSGGCGIVYKNNYYLMYRSLQKIKSLPNKTFICPGHEYTLINLKFAISIMPQDIFLKKYYDKIKKIILKNKLPFFTNLSLEKKINIFLRCNDKYLKKNMNIVNTQPWKIFKILRKKKDYFNSSFL